MILISHLIQIRTAWILVFSLFADRFTIDIIAEPVVLPYARTSEVSQNLQFLFTTTPSSVSKQILICTNKQSIAY